MRLVVALGGNALLRRGERPEARLQQAHVAEAVAALAPLASDHELVITHGNGPQVGVLAAQSSADPSLQHPYPLDVIGAQTQGMIGYWITSALRGVLPGRRVAGLLDQTLVTADDPALLRPTKPVGPVLEEPEARQLADRYGWQVAPEAAGWRRVVGSPEPVEVLDAPVVADLLAAGVVVCCAGGGGVPVIRDETGRLQGVEAVVDKDLASALLAEAVGADQLLVLTDVPGVLRPDGSVVRELRPADLAGLDLPAGSMGPKVEAAMRFARRTGGRAVIGDIAETVDLAAGRAGTTVVPEEGAP